MADERDLAAGAADLEKLADELDGQVYVTTVVTGGGRRPALQVTDRAAMQRAEYIYSDGESFWWGWAERFAGVGDIAAAAAAVDRVLRVIGGNR